MFQVFPENADIAPSKRVKFGIDPTFPRLHLGHFVPLRLVKKMIQQGHKATIVLGTFTAQLGDPSGRDTTRPIISGSVVEHNANEILRQVMQVMGDNWQDFTVFKNGSAHNHMSVPQFFKLASQFSLSHMTSRNAFAERIANNHPIALHELLVPICQGWDSVHLQTEIEIGGQDQLFNFQVARQLQESHGQPPQACILMPIIRGTDGRKMSKSLGNCIFIDENPNDMFGQIMSIPDDVMQEWFPLFVDFTMDDDIHPMDKKKILATEVVSQLHGVTAGLAASENFLKTVQQKELPKDIPNITASTVLEAVITMDGCSKTAARKLLKSGGITVDGEKVSDETLSVQSGQIVGRGKRKFAKIT